MMNKTTGDKISQIIKQGHDRMHRAVYIEAKHFKSINRPSVQVDTLVETRLGRYSFNEEDNADDYIWNDDE